jgi:hypothetical protein
MLSRFHLNPLTPELISSAQRYLPRFLLMILIFKGLNAQRLYTSFGVKELNPSPQRCLPRFLLGI